MLRHWISPSSKKYMCTGDGGAGFVYVRFFFRCLLAVVYTWVKNRATHNRTALQEASRRPLAIPRGFCRYRNDDEATIWLRGLQRTSAVLRRYCSLSERHVQPVKWSSTIYWVYRPLLSLYFCHETNETFQFEFPQRTTCFAEQYSRILCDPCVFVWWRAPHLAVQIIFQRTERWKKAIRTCCSNKQDKEEKQHQDPVVLVAFAPRVMIRPNI